MASASKRVGKYDLLAVIGQGSFGTVRKAIDTETGLTWAIKIVEKAKLQEDHGVEQLKKEIALMKLLKHENIVQLREVMQSQHYVYMVMELVSGGELFDKIVSSRKLKESVARKYFQQLIMGVAACHQNGVAHRDLKPENLLLDENDVIKISDFGLSNWMPKTGEALLVTPCGTANYVAPEVLKERGYNGCVADIWSCGVILFVMLAGYRPFEDKNMNALFNKIERGEYSMDRSFTPLAQDLISKILVVEPSQRYTIAQILQHPWFVIDFDINRTRALAAALPAPTQDQVDHAIAPGTSPAMGSSLTPPTQNLAPPAAPTGPIKLDAFDIVNKLTLGILTPLSSQQDPAANKGLVRRVLVRATIDEVSIVLERLLGMPPTRAPAPAANELKGFTNGATGLVTFGISFTATTAPGIYLMECRRGRGDFLEFQSLIDKLLAAMQGQLVSVDAPH